MRLRSFGSLLIFTAYSAFAGDVALYGACQLAMDERPAFENSILSLLPDETSAEAFRRMSAESNSLETLLHESDQDLKNARLRLRILETDQARGKSDGSFAVSVTLQKSLLETRSEEYAHISAQAEIPYEKFQRAKRDRRSDRLRGSRPKVTRLRLSQVLIAAGGLDPRKISPSTMVEVVERALTSASNRSDDFGYLTFSRYRRDVVSDRGSPATGPVRPRPIFPADHWQATLSRDADPGVEEDHRLLLRHPQSLYSLFETPENRAAFFRGDFQIAFYRLSDLIATGEAAGEYFLLNDLLGPKIVHFVLQGEKGPKIR